MRARIPAAAPAVATVQATRHSLGLRVAFAFALILVLEAALTVVAGSRLEGTFAWVALAIGGTAMAATAVSGWWLLQWLVLPLSRVAAVVGRLSTGQLAEPVDEGGTHELQPLMHGLSQVRERWFTAVGQVRMATNNVAMNARQVTRDNEALAGRTDTQADSLQETAASIEQLSATLRQSASNAREAHSLARAAADGAQMGGELMRDVVQTMETIRESSQNIREIIGVIDAIAFQTNILALNAAVEAARAGEQGRGFAVVAAEVRRLAQRCGEAASEIRKLIGASVDKVDLGGSQVDQAGAAIAEIVTVVRQVSDLIGQVDEATQEQSAGIETINVAINRIDGTTQDNALLVNSAARTAAALRERAGVLLQAVATFDLGAREHGSADEARDLVERACEFARVHGRDALVADVNRLEQGRFLERDLSLMVLDFDGVIVAHGHNPGRIGTGPQLRDLAGKCFPVEFARVARDRGEGWVDYLWQHFVSGEPVTKSAYVRRVGNLAIACPVYKA